MTDLNSIFQPLSRLKQTLNSVIRGREDTVDLVLTGLISGGHVLIEDYPGSGKTTLAKTLGRSIDCKVINEELKHILAFRRIQFTPDLLPADVLGVNIFEPKSATFNFQHGPIFAHVVLADEINRTGPKVQAAFLECMAEKQVTVDNHTYQLDELFFVLGTQNPLDLAGTYPLPLVQLDRFILKVPMKYVTREREFEILKESETISNSVDSAKPVITREEILAARAASHNIQIKDSILEAIVSIVQSTRGNNLLQFGVSTRAAIMLKRTICSWAVLQGRDYATEDDLKYLAPFVLKHRVKFHPGINDTDAAFNEIIKPHIETLIKKSAY